MKNDFDIIAKTELFGSIGTEDLTSILHCLDARRVSYQKNDFLILEDAEVTHVGIVIKGNVQIVKEDIDGNRVIVDELRTGEMFGEAIACAELKKSPVAVLAAADSDILFIELKKIIRTCAASCTCHGQLIENLLKTIARKNIMLNRKMDILSKKTIRDKIITYLNLQMKSVEDRTFTIPFTRDELADYICVNRSALSRELGHMRDEGLLEFQKNKFKILY